MISLLLHESEAKPRMNVNNKDIIASNISFRFGLLFVLKGYLWQCHFIRDDAKHFVLMMHLCSHY